MIEGKDKQSLKKYLLNKNNTGTILAGSFFVIKSLYWCGVLLFTLGSRG